MNELLLNKSPIWAAQNKQKGRMRPAGRQFDMPDLELQQTISLLKFISSPNYIITARKV